MLSVETGVGEIKMRNVTYYFIVSKVGHNSKVAIRLVLYYYLLVVFWGELNYFVVFFTS